MIIQPMTYLPISVGFYSTSEGKLEYVCRFGQDHKQNAENAVKCIIIIINSYSYKRKTWKGKMIKNVKMKRKERHLPDSHL